MKTIVRTTKAVALSLLALDADGLDEAQKSWANHDSAEIYIADAADLILFLREQGFFIAPIKMSDEMCAAMRLSMADDDDYTEIWEATIKSARG